jgi:hypothetical protein
MLFRATNPELPFIAANAALELDNYIRGISTDLDNLNTLSSMLKESTASEQDIPMGVKRFIDPASSDVFNKAYNASHEQSIESNDDLYKQMAQLAEEMSSIDDTDGELPVVIKNFCIALSEYAMATHSYLDDTQHKHPNRK